MCDSVVATSLHTARGRTLFAKNSDRKQGECQPFVQFPAAHYARGDSVRCTHIEIAQVSETYRVMGHSPWWVWGFEHGVNEHAVAIGNHTVFSNEPVEEAAGLIGMDVVRLGLERGRSSREALEVIAGLLEAHGQGGSALAPGAAGYHNSFLLADPVEAWILETSGRHWAARRTQLDALSNHLCTADDWEIASRDLDAFAREQGFWKAKERVDVAAAYRNPHVPGRLSEGRRRRARGLLAGGRGALTRASLAALLRDHGGATRLPPDHLTPQDDGYYTLCMHSEPVGTTTASLLVELPEDASEARPWPVWIGFGSPCVGILLPVYLQGVLPPEVARGGAERDPDSLWWRFERLRELAARDFARYLPLLRAGWAELEAELESGRSSLEAEACAQAEEQGPVAGQRLLTEAMCEMTGRVGRRAEELADAIA